LSFIDAVTPFYLIVLVYQNYRVLSILF